LFLSLILARASAKLETRRRRLCRGVTWRVPSQEKLAACLLAVKLRRALRAPTAATALAEVFAIWSSAVWPRFSRSKASSIEPLLAWPDCAFDRSQGQGWPCRRRLRQRFGFADGICRRDDAIGQAEAERQIRVDAACLAARTRARGRDHQARAAKSCHRRSGHESDPRRISLAGRASREEHAADRRRSARSAAPKPDGGPADRGNEGLRARHDGAE